MIKYLLVEYYRDEKIGSTFNETKLFISNTKKCSCCGIELRCGDAMVIESMQLSYHIECFKCCVCYEHLGTDIQVRNKKLHCLNCFSGDDGTYLFTVNKPFLKLNSL